jgi:HAE1 family hydrophobic/amphiphilic exporter-1
MMTRTIRLLVAGACIVGSVAPGWAQTTTSSEPQAVLPARVGVAPGSGTAFTLEEAIRLALDQNNDVAVARLDRDVAAANVRAALGFMDPRLLPTLQYERATSPVTSVIGGGANGSVNQDTWVAGAELTGRSPWAGGRFSFDFTSTRLKTTNSFQRLNPQYPITTGVTYVQPLARGLTFDAERRQLLVSRTNVDLTDARLALVLMDQLSLVEQAYWDLAFASRNVEVQAAALVQARRQVDSNQRQATQGTLAPIDVVEAETQVAAFEQSVATAQLTLTEAENRLKNLVLTDRQSPLWNQALIPAELGEPQVPQLSLDAALALALSRRPELTEFAVTVAQNKIDRRFYAEQARPKMDLVARYALSGLAGTFVEQASDPIGGPTTIPEFFFGGFGSSLSTIASHRFPTLSLQLQVDLPLGNRTASANVARTAINADQLVRVKQQIEQMIAAEVRNSLQAVESSHRRLMAAAAAARNAREQYESEQRRFESGLGTVFLVLERQTALVTAQAQELRARADVKQALARLDRAVGGTLQRHGVALQTS